MKYSGDHIAPIIEEKTDEFIQLFTKLNQAEMLMEFNYKSKIVLKLIFKDQQYFSVLAPKIFLNKKRNIAKRAKIIKTRSKTSQENISKKIKRKKQVEDEVNEKEREPNQLKRLEKDYKNNNEGQLFLVQSSQRSNLNGKSNRQNKEGSRESGTQVDINNRKARLEIKLFSSKNNKHKNSPYTDEKAQKKEKIQGFEIQKN